MPNPSGPAPPRCHPVDPLYRAQPRNRIGPTRLAAFCSISCVKSAISASRLFICRAWKKALQDNLCTPHRITVTVSHYPPGASKWNPMEHRLFSHISNNRAGELFTTIEKTLKFISTTKTEPGLVVKSYLIDEYYETGIKVSRRRDGQDQPRYA